jgi:sigma-B regulation protein RsbU (phosphoserine phosphatase)
MADPRLEVNDGLGRRVIPIDKPTLTIGRRTESDVRLVGSDVSREHAEILQKDGALVLLDRGSRYGTFVNGEAVTEHRLAHGDRVQFGRTGGAEVVYLTDAAGSSGTSTAGTAVGDIRQMATLLEGLRALGSGRVLDEVLALVLDAAIGVTGAERGFIMLAGDDRQLEMKLARARGRVTLPGNRFDTSRKIPEEVYSTGELKVVQDLLDDHLAKDHQGTVALGIRQVLCTPLRLVRYLDRPDMLPESRAIGVLYLDSREKGQLLSQATRGALDTLANEAGVAIENARLYRETLEKARIEHELRIAAEIQRSLLPLGKREGDFFQAMGASLPSRSIGGDFFEYPDMDDGAIGVILGDVAGKGPAAALLTAKIQGLFSAQSGDGSPASAMKLVNNGLLKRQIDARYATVFFATLTPGGVLTYCNAGHNPPVVVRPTGVGQLASGSVPVGLFSSASYSDDRIQLEPGDVLVIYSDGVTEALNLAGDEFGDERLATELMKTRTAPLPDILQGVITAVQSFAAGASQSDDVTVLVARYMGPKGNVTAGPPT